MAAYFMDSSALLKRYVIESGTQWVRSLFHSRGANDISIAAIAAVEVLAAVSRRARGVGISAAEATRIISLFRSDLQHDFDVIAVSAAVIDSGMDMAQRHALRGYDAVQLATALEVRRIAASLGTKIIFVSSDRELNAAAMAEGLAVEDPNQHP